MNTNTNHDNKDGGKLKNQEWRQIKEKLLTSRFFFENSKNVIDDYEDIELNEAKILNKYRHAAHVLIWARNPNKLWEHDLVAAILMQMRFDGYIGFPGGYLECDDLNPEEGLNRELKEEIDLEDRFAVVSGDYLYSSVNHKSGIVLHFYAKEVSLDDFVHIEKHSLESSDYGGEVFGVLRPPLFETDKGSDKGFVKFMRNQFVGNSLVQLLRTIHHFDILPFNQLIYFLDKF